MTYGTVGVRAWRGTSLTAGRAHLGADVVAQTGVALASCIDVAVGGGDGIAARLKKAAAFNVAQADLEWILISVSAAGSVKAGIRQSILAAGFMAAWRAGQAASREEIFVVVGGDVVLEVAVGTLPVDDGGLSRMSGHSKEGDGKNSHGLVK